uniref:Leucine-rich repeat protein SHOC-2 n=1 Tax=Talaromyces marneffei PM1 TaxID=1077442 RepID=A0A093V3N6_TALMA
MVEEPATTTRSGRVITPSTRAREAAGSDNISAVRTSKKSMTQVELTAVKKAAGLIKEKQNGKDGNRDMLKKIGHLQMNRCAAVVKDAKNADRIKVVCRHEDEIQLVKEAAQKLKIPGLRVLRDQLYPVKIDNTNRKAVLDADGNILLGAAEALGKENNINIAKISWLSKKDSNKVYRSMVVYVTKGTDAKRLIDGNYFDIVGESTYTRIFEPQMGPAQYFNC